MVHSFSRADAFFNGIIAFTLAGMAVYEIRRWCRRWVQRQARLGE